MCRVKRNEDKKAGKERRKRSKRKFGTVLAKKSPNFDLSMHRSELLYIVTRNLYQNVAVKKCFNGKFWPKLAS